MTRKVAIVADPGIDTAFAIALALHDPGLDVVGLLPTAGNVRAEQATANAHILINQLDPPKWPRVGTALPVGYELDGEKLHGPGGLGGVPFPMVTPHQQTPSDKLLVELARAYPGEITLIILGPATAAAAALERDPEVAELLARIVCVGGSWRETGNASPVAEFHFYCDPFAAREVLRCDAEVTLVPLDVTRKLIFSPTDLLQLPCPHSRTCSFLREIVPYGIRASSNLYGIEGFHLKDVLGVAAVALPGAVTVREMWVDVETRGELTRGMSVVDPRRGLAPPPNVFLATDVDVAAVRGYIDRILRAAS